MKKKEEVSIRLCNSHVIAESTESDWGARGQPALRMATRVKMEGHIWGWKIMSEWVLVISNMGASNSQVEDIESVVSHDLRSSRERAELQQCSWQWR
jgi:hypothetical protein